MNDSDMAFGQQRIETVHGVPARKMAVLYATSLKVEDLNKKPSWTFVPFDLRAFPATCICWNSSETVKEGSYLESGKPAGRNETGGWMRCRHRNRRSQSSFLLTFCFVHRATHLLPTLKVLSVPRKNFKSRVATCQ